MNSLLKSLFWELNPILSTEEFYLGWGDQQVWFFQTINMEIDIADYIGG